MARTKKQSIKVSAPRANPLGSHRRPSGFVSEPQQKRPKVQTRIYTKSAQRQDPTEFMKFGFGDTGLTGES